MSDIKNNEKDNDKIKKIQDKKIVPGYITYPLTEVSERDPDSKSTIPPISAVAELRDWSIYKKQ